MKGMLDHTALGRAPLCMEALPGAATLGTGTGSSP